MLMKRRRPDGKPETRTLDDLLAEAARRLNTQGSMTRTLTPGVQIPPVRIESRLQHFDENCPAVEAAPEDLEARLQRAVRAASPPLWKRLFL